MIEITTALILLYVILVHWVADFIFQAEVWALGKRKNIKLLLQHTLTYSAVTTILLISLLWSTSWGILWFFLITFILHTIIDYITSKIVGRKFENKELGSPIPNLGAFTIIGFDQVLHYISLFLTLCLIL